MGAVVVHSVALLNVTTDGSIFSCEITVSDQRNTREISRALQLVPLFQLIQLKNNSYNSMESFVMFEIVQ